MSDVFRPKERMPWTGELSFFAQNPQVGGMIDPQGRNQVVLNPAPRFDREKQAIYDNEAYRLGYRKSPPDVSLTPEQERFLNRTSYRDAPDEDRAATIMARLLTGDPSGGRPSFEQDVLMRKTRNHFTSPIDEAIGRGLRHDGSSFKGKGFLGEVPNPSGGYSTEVSMSLDDVLGGRDFPQMVPGLSKSELASVLKGSPTRGAIGKAIRHAIDRDRRGLSPFKD